MARYIAIDPRALLMQEDLIGFSGNRGEPCSESGENISANFAAHEQQPDSYEENRLDQTNKPLPRTPSPPRQTGMVDGEAMGGIHVVQEACGVINHERINHHIE